jgi:hypothetical protein
MLAQGRSMLNDGYKLVMSAFWGLILVVGTWELPLSRASVVKLQQCTAVRVLSR